MAYRARQPALRPPGRMNIHTGSLQRRRGRKARREIHSKTLSARPLRPLRLCGEPLVWARVTMSESGDGRSKAATVKPRLLSGFRDFLPRQALLRQRVLAICREVFERYGYEPFD